MTTATAEPVAAAPPLLVSDEPLYEVVNGERVELPPMSSYSGQIAARLVRQMGYFADTHNLGEVVGEILFLFPQPDDEARQRRPDVAFVSRRRWPANQSAPVRDSWP